MQSSIGPPQSSQAHMPCIPLHPLLDLGQCIYIEGRWTPYPPANQAQMPCILLHPLLDLGPCIYIYKADGPHSQLSIDALNTTTANILA